VLQKSVVDHTVAERLKWSKFGQEKGKASGPDRATTTVGENVALKISAGNKVRSALAFEVNLTPQQHGVEPEKEEESTKIKLAKAGAGKVVCRLCKGEHFTAKCPHKEALAGLEMGAYCLFKQSNYLNCCLDATAAGDDDAPAETAAPSLGAGGSGGKYVPVWLRPGAKPPPAGSGGPGGNRDDLPTLRVTNLSEDTQENDLRELFGIFGRVARVFVGRDRETGAGKGFAFVSFEERAVAQKAMEKVNGKGYDNLILSVQWSRESSFFSPE
jgi:translation initiation factor 3 subunit G